MDDPTLGLVASIQAELDETQDRLAEVLGMIDVLAQAIWELATALEWSVEETARDGHMRQRVLGRLALAIEAIEEVLGENRE